MPDLEVTAPGLGDVVEAFAAAGVLQSSRAEEIMRFDPSIDYRRALVLAGDEASATDADRDLASGRITFEEGLVRVGSTKRVEWALRATENGAIKRIDLYRMLPDLWRDSDPDDTAIPFVALWADAFVANQLMTILDDESKRLPSVPVLTVHRWQPNRRMGLTWSLSKKALTAEIHPVRGELLTGKVARRYAMAFLSKGNRAEVIVAPGRVQITKVERL